MNPPNTNVRVSLPNDRPLSFDNWHVDGGFASVLLSLHGPGVEGLGPAPKFTSRLDYNRFFGDDWLSLCTDCNPFVVPTNSAIIFFGIDSGVSSLYHPLIHRTPNFAGERVLFVIRY